MVKSALTNALVFDGHSLQKNLTVVINHENGLIESIGASSDIDINDVDIIDCQGSTLLPGFIDAHIHLSGDVEKSRSLLLQLAQAGVTTGLDMGYFPASVRESLRSYPGIADVRFAGTFATSTGSTHSRFPQAKKTSLVDDTKMAAEFVEARVAEGADYIKIISDVPGPSQEVVNALAAEAQKHGKLSIAHASSKISFTIAQEGKVDIITHVPMDQSLDEDAASLMRGRGAVCVPTLIMMQTVANSMLVRGLAFVGIVKSRSYAAAKESVTLLHQAGVPILAGTDANQSGIASVKHGSGFHQELMLLVEAGLSNEEVLRAGTSLPAKWFRMEDRGVIETGKRADLVLVSGNPIDDIAVTRNINKVWIVGKEVVLKK